MTEIDGLDIHFIHVQVAARECVAADHHARLARLGHRACSRSSARSPIRPRMAGRAEDAFDLVLPSMPGYGFSGEPTEAGWDPDRIARAWAELMNRLGYTRYVAQGGDQGANVTDAMGRLAPKGLVGIHLNLLGAFPPAVLAAIFGGSIPAPEGLLKRLAVAVVAAAANKEPVAFNQAAAVFKRGYFVEMGEHPQTVGYSLTDSPVGLAAWMLDHDPDSYEKISHAFVDGKPAGGLTRDRIVDNITLYWLTSTATSSARLYWEETQSIGAALASGQKPPEALAAGGVHRLPERDLPGAAELGGEGLPQPHLLPRGRQGRALRRVGRAGALRRPRCARRSAHCASWREGMAGTLCARRPAPQNKVRSRWPIGQQGC